MVFISCSGKFHAFALAEQLQKHDLLTGFFTGYAYQKNVLLRRFARRIDKEAIPAAKIHTYLPWAIQSKLKWKDEFSLNEVYDYWVSRQIARRNDYRIFIGWSGMSLHSIRQAKKAGKLTILERGSSHIQYQNDILKEEYAKFGIAYQIDPRVIEKELQEYEEADYISIPSQFVRDSFLQKGIPAKKLFITNYGTSTVFKPILAVRDAPRPFRILYLGSMTIRKGLLYLFEALKAIDFEYEAWFIGAMDEPTSKLYQDYHQSNWKYFGHINHYDLPQYISACDVAVQPSLEEGLSMVIPQIISCGVPVIATTNSGGGDIIEEKETGFILSPRDSKAIKNSIIYSKNNPVILKSMQDFCLGQKQNISWDSYGSKYANFLRTQAG